MVIRVKNKRPGLTSFQIKLLGIFFMTLGSFVPYGYEIPVIARFSVQLTLCGRIALPLFLYMLTESIRHTQSKLRFVFRLYIAAVGVGLFTTITNICTGNTIGIYRQSNILFTYFYTVVYIVLIEKILRGFSQKSSKPIVFGITGIAVTVLVHFFIVLIRPVVVSNRIIGDLFECIFVSPYYVEETPIVILIGILLFFCTTKWQKVSIIGIVSLLSQCRLLAELSISTPMSVFFNGPQLYTILAIPIMLLYNGKRGSEKKAFFYCYYPLHWYAIAVIKYFWLVK